MISRRPARECENVVRGMLVSMQHEPFYRAGTYSIPELGVYAGWVALKDSFAADQVFLNEHHDVALVFSGECFADPEVRNSLRRKGHCVEKNGGWLVHLYEEQGEQFFGQLNGLFSGLLVDKRRRKAFLFNDRYGAERIYWHETNDDMYFASEAKALLRVLPELREFDEDGLAQFITYGCTLEERTLFRGIHLLPGGSLWSFEDCNCRKQRYFSSVAWESQPLLSAECFEAAFQEAFKKVLPRYFESDSEIGISLTGGLDSRMIMSGRPHNGERPICYTFSGEKGETFDDRLAARVAKACGLEHRLLRIASDFFSEFASHADRTVYITDGCFGVTGAHEIYLNRQARELAPVRMTGNYGSEVLRGTSTFKRLNLSASLLEPQFGQALNSLTEPWANGNTHPVTFAAFCEIPWNLFGSLAAGRSQVIVRTPYLDNEIVALAYQAPDTLRRSRFLGWHIVKGDGGASLSQIPTDRGWPRENFALSATFGRFFSKATFKLDYLNNEGCPHWLSSFDSVFTRVTSSLGLVGLHKYLHYRSWFRRELAEYIKSIVNDPQTQRTAFWSRDFLEHLAAEHIQGGKNYVLEINVVLTLEAVERLLLRGSSFGIEESRTSLDCSVFAQPGSNKG